MLGNYKKSIEELINNKHDEAFNKKHINDANNLPLMVYSNCQHFDCLPNAYVKMFTKVILCSDTPI